MPSVASNLIEEIEKEAKNMKAKYQQTSIGELYDRLLRKYSIVEQRYSIVEMVLESRINKLVKQGLTREQAIREIAGNEEVLEL